MFGLLQNGRVDEQFLRRLIPRLPPADCEVYTHPTTQNPREELEALTSPAVRALIRDRGVRLIRYADL